MTLAIELNTFAIAQNNAPSETHFYQWINETLLAVNHIDAVEISLSILPENEMQALNKTFREKDKSTNVLSFPAELEAFIPSNLLGDIIFCQEVIAREASEQNKPLQAHWAHMTVHGTLHLLGYDHIETLDAEEMEALEISILKDLNFSNPYQQLN